MLKARDNIDYVTKDYEGYRVNMLNGLKQRIPSYDIDNALDPGVVITELLASGLDTLAYYYDFTANETYLSTAKTRKSVVKRANEMGYFPLNSTPAKFLQVIEITPQETDFVLPKGSVFKNEPSAGEEEIVYELDSDFIIPAGHTGIEKDIFDKYIYTAKITEGFTIAEEIVGSSNGTANQEFQLQYQPVIETSVALLVNEGQGFQPWNRIKSFIDSGVYTKDFLLTIDEYGIGTIEFGNDTSGKIPSVYANGILASYRVGGGTKGNLPANTITTMESKPAGLVRTFNPSTAYEEGTDMESLDSIKLKAPASLRTMWRAVTIRDFEDLGMLQDGILSVKALQDEVTGYVNVYLQKANTMTSDELTWFQNFYNERVILGIRVAVHDVNYNVLTLGVDVKTYSNCKNADIQALVDAKIRELTSVGTYKFGEDYIPSDLITQVMKSIPEVKSISFTPSADITPTNIEIIKVGMLTVTVTGGV
jgi:hypothetical protein